MGACKLRGPRRSVLRNLALPLIAAPSASCARITRRRSASGESSRVDSATPLAWNRGIAGPPVEIGELLLGVANERFRRGDSLLHHDPLAVVRGGIGSRPRRGEHGLRCLDTSDRIAER